MSTNSDPWEGVCGFSNTHTLDRVDEVLSDENWQLKNLERLGLTVVEAIDAVAQKVDYHDVEKLVNKGCPPQLAVKIV